MTAITQFNEKLSNFEKQKKILIKELKNDLKDVMKELFATIPDIKTIYWTQYTPYFMDGDECVFSINDILVSNSVKAIADYAGDDLGDDDLWAEDANNVSKDYIPNKEHRKTLKDFSSTIHKNQSLIKEIFGDHVKVIGTRNGFKTEEYEHD